MKKILLLFLIIFASHSIFGQSTVTIGAGSSISVGNGSNLTAANRDGTMLNTGYFNSRSIVLDPVATSATSITQSSFFTNWNASAGASGYKLDVSTDINFGSFITGYQNLNVGSVVTYSVTGLSGGTTYYYRLRAYDIDGITGYSNIIAVVTAPDPPVATAATSIAEFSFSANWGTVTGATKYYLDVATNSSFALGTFVAGFNNIDVGNVLTYSVTGLSANDTYYFRIRSASSSGGISTNSNTITVLTAPLAPVATAAASLAQTSFSARWDASSGATKYYLDVSTVNTFASFVTGWNNTDVGNVTAFSVNSGLAAGTTYYYRVRSSNGAGISTNSNTITVLTVPPTPVATAATSITQTSFSANWGATATATKYYIDVATDNLFTSPVGPWTNVDMGNVTTYSVATNLTSGTTYYYRIRSENASGASSNSNVITLVTIPPAPATTAATAITTTGFTANWNASLSATKYFLDVSTSNTFSSFVTGWSNVDVSNVLTYAVSTNINAGITYYYRVRAFNASGTSTNSNTTNLITIPPQPVTIAATGVSTTSFNANWNNTTGAAGYYIDVATDAGFTSMVTGWTNVDAGAVTTYSVATNLTAGTNYYYRVRAYNASGTSVSSTETNVLTAPVAPVATASSGSGAGNFNANWNVTVGATGYYLDVATDNGFGAGSLVGGFNNLDVANVLTYNVNINLSPGTTYYYRVRSYNSGGISTSSNTITTSTAPSNPISTAASAITSIDFNANWNAVTGATGYNLDVSTDPACAGSFVGVYNDLNVNNVLTYNISGLSSNTTYYYRVRAYNSYGTSTSSEIITTLTSPGATTSDAATTVTASGFAAKWIATAGATGYFLDVSTVNNFASFVSGFNGIDVGNVITYLVSGLSSGTTYYYRVRAYNSGGTGANSGNQTVLTLPPPPVAVAASAISATGFTANWNAATSASGYRLDVSTDPVFAGGFVGVYNDYDAGNVTLKAIAGLTDGVTYYYRLRTYNGTGTGSNSNIIMVTTIPAAPTEQAATSITSNSFVTNWLASTGATGYKLDVSTVSNFASFVTGYQDLDVGNVLTYGTTGLTAGTPYWYRIRAYNTAGESGNSGSINPTTTGLAPRAPASNPATVITSTSFSANWVASAGATGYKLDVSTASDFSSYVPTWQNVDVAALTKSVNANITAGTQYYYRVRAYNADGTSGNSSTVSVITVPDAPVDDAAANITNSGFDAKWIASTGATGYKLDVSTAGDFSSFVTGYNNLDVSNVTSYTVTGLLQSTLYHYRVRAYNTGGTSSDCPTVDATTDANPAATFSATAATAIAETGFTANWVANGGATTGYRLDVSTDPAFGSFTGIYHNLDVANVTTYSVTGLTGGTVYYYRVIAHDVTPADIATSTTVSVLTIPAAPTTNAASLKGETSFTANWTASTGATGYYIDVATDAGLTSFVTGFNNKYVNNATSYSITGLTAGTQYYYQVRAKNGSGISSSSGSTSTFTLPKEPNTISASTIQSASFVANWDAVTGATTYYIDVATDDVFTNIVPAWNNVNVGNVTTKLIDVGLIAGTAYYYRVRSSNTAGLSISYSNLISLTTAPDAPTANNASSVDKTTFTANWTASTGATKYFLDVSTSSGFGAGSFVPGFENRDVGNVVTYPISGLSRGITYYYRIRAYNSNGTSTDSGTKSALTISAEPDVLSATTIQSTSFSANWNASIGAASYKLSVSTDPAFAGGFIGGYNNFDIGNFTVKSITGLTAGTTYYYRVKAVNATGDSDNSGVITVTTAPSSPTATAATSLGETSVNANWNTSAGADGYLLDVSTVSNFTSFIAGFNSKDVHNVTTYPVTGLTGGSTYYYRIRSYTGSRPSDNSDPITFLTKPVASFSTAESAVGTTGFTANWNSTSSATGYKLEVSTNSGFTSYIATYGPKDVGLVITYPISGLTANTNYYYRVSAYNASGTGLASGYQSVLTAPITPTPSAATSITNITMNANWGAVAGAAGYRLDVSTDPAFGSFVFGFNDKDVSNVTTYSVTGLNGNTNYYYRVRAYNAGGTSSSSGNITATTAPDPSPAPVSTAATALAQTSVSANWNAAATATGYKLDVATDLGFTSYVSGFENLDVANVLTYSVTGLTAGTTYYFRTRSYNGTGTSSNSNVITVLTVPPVPVSSAVTSQTETSFSANWALSTGAIKYYLDVSTDPAFGSFTGAYNNLDVGNVTTSSVTLLTGGITYYYRVRSNNASGTSGNSGNITVLTKPAAPVASAATTVASTSFSANWAASTGAANYYLDVSTDPAFGSFVTGYNNKDVSNVITYSVTGLTASTTYYYRVRANNATGTSGNSNTITIVGLPTATAATSVNEAGFAANWGSVAGATKYFLDVSTASDFSSFVAGFNNADVGNVVTIPVAGLAVNTTYYYRIRAFNAAGTSDNSNSITLLTASPVPVATAATAKTNASFTSNWNASAGATGYYLDVATDNAFTEFLDGYENKDVGNVLTYNLTGLNIGTTYYYRVRSHNTGPASSSSSNIISVLAAPMASSATNILQTSFSANWTTVTGATKYYVDVATTNSFTAGTFVAGYQDLDVGNVITLSVTGLINNTEYFYRVRAFDATGVTGNSNTMGVWTLPLAPTAIAATGITLNSFNANWNIMPGGAAGYRLDVATDIAFTTFVAGYDNLNVGNVNSFPIPGLTAGTTYYYRVRSSNSWGTSDNSNIITALMFPANPVANEPRDESTTSFIANWGPVLSAVKYKLDVATDSLFANMIVNDSDVGNNLQQLVRGLNSNTVYYYRVRAINATGASGNSNRILAATLPEKPVISALETGVKQYVIKQSKIKITDSLKVQTPETSPIQWAEIIISGNYIKNEDQLTTNEITGITNSWDSENGKLTLIGPATAEVYQSAIRAILYVNNSINPSPVQKGITITVNNGFFESNSLTRSIQIKEGNETPVLSNLESDRLVYLKGVSPLRIAVSSNIIAEDPDNANLQRAEIKISSGYIKNEDYLDFTNTNLVTGSFNGETGTLTLTGSSSVFSYQNILREVTYRNSKQANGTSSIKSLEITVNDGLACCAVVTRELQIKAPLETPTNLNGSIISNRFNLTWTDTNIGEGGYIIERSEGNNFTFVEIARTDSNAVAYSDAGIINGKKYYYRVAAYKAELKSDYSSEVSVIGIVVGLSDQNGVPKDYVISQNYPNPFNPTTAIIFGLPYESRVNIVIFNSIGQQIEELLDETRAAGYYKVNWNGSKLPSGIYIYRISAISVEGGKQFADVKRMVLVK